MVKKINSETERKIKQAAKEIFIKKWLSWSRTREITEKAWVNLALLNYYFWWKDELYNIIIMEIINDFQESMFKILDDPKTSFDDKLDYFIEWYYNAIVNDYKKLPFMLDILKNNIDEIKDRVRLWKHVFTKTYFAKQFMEKTWRDINMFREFFVNFLWIITFPVVWAPLFSAFFEYEDDNYYDFLINRKKFIRETTFTYIKKLTQTDAHSTS